MASSIPAPKLPAGLVGFLNRPENLRDSAYFSTKDSTSKHNSIQSSNEVHTIDQQTRARVDTASAVDVKPSRRCSGSRISSLSSPISGTMSVASIVSPTYQGFSQTLREPGSHNSGISTSSAVSVLSNNNDDLRRESVDSRLGANFGDMRLANSPYASANPSTTSLQSNLAQQRNPSSALQDRGSVPYLISNGRIPRYPRMTDAEPMINASRIAPLITGPAQGAIARASEPTKGQAWAFPEEPIHRQPSTLSSRPGSFTRHTNQSFNEPRRESFAESVASSRYTTDSCLPLGQRRLEDGMPSDYSQEGCSDYKALKQHQILQHRQVADLTTDGESLNNSQPYSRTPELRVSHKLAERKRRMEMKDMFDSLRALQNVDRGAKASKWEILSKAITEHERQAKLIDEQKKAITRIESQLHRTELELNDARRDSNNVRDENARLRSEINSLQIPRNGPYGGPESHPHIFNAQVIDQKSQLPPFRSLQVPEVMNGVQYHHEQRPDHIMSKSQSTMSFNQR
ncbi:putative hlh transcription factor [Erysiphe neolycopersici]|uniref:Putative hlh transcription factor n=1 Tax=Erysiphe neolycopersici TaxID=212602 RepID=A0A420HZQ0_9PEZI|nr:putative hlh transcription factor [Erysiphe neolycopersici]